MGDAALSVARKATLLGELADAAADAVIAGIADAMYAARHAATKDGKPIGEAAAWRKFCDEPTLRLLRALAAFDATHEWQLVQAAARLFGEGEARNLAQLPALGAG